VARWWSRCSRACPGAQTRPPRRQVERCTLQRWMPPTQGVENPPSATCRYRLHYQLCTRETRGQQSVQKL
jgi:hypothetical protein